MDEAEAILVEIKSGVTHFSPDSEKEDDRINFQAKAKIIAHLNNEGLITDIDEIRESMSGNRYIVSISILGGLTHDGESYLRSTQEKC